LDSLVYIYNSIKLDSRGFPYCIFPQKNIFLHRILE
jgi:hypothetical protein